MKQASTTLSQGSRANLGRVARSSFFVSLSALLLFCLSFLILPYLIVEASAATNVSTDTTWVATSLTLDPDYGNGSVDDDGHGDVSFGTIIPTSRSGENLGTMKVLKKTVQISSSGKYYSVYLSMNDESNALKLNGNDSNIKINSVSGSWDAPAKFSGTGWGFAVPGTSIPTSDSTWEDSSVPEYPIFSQASTFYNSESSTYHDLGVDLTASDSSVYNQDTWVSVPVLGSAQQIWKATTTNNYGFGTHELNGSMVTGDTVKNHFDVYYGIMVGDDALAGTYTNEIIYTAIASSKSVDEVSNNLLIGERFVNKDYEETIDFDLTLSTAGIVKPSQISVYVVPFSDTSYGTTEEILARLEANKNGYATCDFDKSDDSKDVIFLNNKTTLTCLMPDEAPVWDGMNGDATDGYFDLWVTIPAFGANYISKYNDSSSNARVASVIYAGLQSKDLNGDYMFTKMQEMTGRICKSTNIWNNRTGENARIYDYSGTTPLLEAGVDVSGVSTFMLTDVRDEKSYSVRRLADGECWMTENLQIATFVDETGSYVGKLENDQIVKSTTSENKFTNKSTDLNSKTAWAPKYTTEVWETRTQWREDSDEEIEANLPDSSADIFRGSYYAHSIIRSNLSMYQVASYNFNAATAGSGTWEFVSGDASDSICPKGWQLPVGMGDRSFQEMARTYGITNVSDGATKVAYYAALRSLPIGFVGSGFYYNSAHSGLGSGTLFWTSEGYSNTIATLIDTSDAVMNLYRRDYYNKAYGLAVRCVARE